MVFRAVVVLPLLLTIMCYGASLSIWGQSLKQTRRMGTTHGLSFIDSIVLPIVLGVISISLKRIISACMHS